MAIKTFSPISKEDLQKKVEEAARLNHSIYAILDYLGKDIKVSFSLENFDLGNEGIGPPGLTGLVSLGNGFTFWGMAAGGDWEQPIYFLIYWDGRRLRGYVPTDGNPWNTTTKKAYGNDDEADMKDARKRFPELFHYDTAQGDQTPQCIEDLDLEFNSGLILNDILGHFTPRQKKEK